VHRLRRLRGRLPQRRRHAVHRRRRSPTSASLPQGQVERAGRVLKMVEPSTDAEGFGSCTNHGECSVSCPKDIKFDAIVLLNREYLRARVLGKR
jgi:ferredoxin